MTILMLIEQNYDLHAGGVQRSTSKLAQLFKSKGHAVIVVCLNAQQTDDIIEGIQIFSVNTLEKLDTAKLHQLLHSNNIELVINQSGYSFKITKLLVGLKQVKSFKILNTLRINPLNFITNHESFIDDYLKSKGLLFINSRLLRAFILKYHKLKQAFELHYIIKHIDAFVMLSERFKSELYQIAPKLKQYDAKIYGINNPFQMQTTTLDALKKENAILFVGRLEITQKRVDLLLGIWHQLHGTLPDWEFWIVGSGSEEENMKNYCLKHNLDRVKFFGQQNPDSYYQQAKIFHLTSAFEGFGNVLVEAQSFGCVPILFNSYSAAQDIVNHDTDGILVKPFDTNAYVLETLKLISNPEKLQNMSLSALENVSLFSYKETYKKWDRVFKSLK